MALFDKSAQFISEVRTEMSKVSWPDFESLKESTWIVILLSLILALFIFVVDKVLSTIILQLY